MKTAQTRFSKLGIFLGTLFGTASVATVVMGSGLFWKVMEREGRDFAQQSIGDTTLLLSSHFRETLGHLTERLTELGETQLKPAVQMLSQGVHQRGDPPPLSIGTADTEIEILDLSLWKRSAASGVFDLYPKTKRAYLAMNSKYPSYSTDLVHLVQQSEDTDSPFVLPSFQGHTVISRSTSLMGQKPIFLIAIPLERGAVDDVVVAHVSLDYLQKTFQKDEMAETYLVDDFGGVLASSANPKLGTLNIKNTPLFQEMHSSKVTSGQKTFKDEQSRAFYGGFSRVGVGELAILSSISEAETNNELVLLKKQTIVFSVGCFILFFAFGYLLSMTQILSDPKRRYGSRFNDTPEGAALQAPKKLTVTVLSGGIRHLEAFLENEKPEEAVEAINDYLTLAESTVKEYGGIFERYSATSFSGVWGAPREEGTEVWCATRCALDLRQYFFKLNEVRKVDGKKVLYFGIGINTGEGVAARFGSVNRTHYTVVGTVGQCAKALRKLTYKFQVDLLISAESWKRSEAKFVGSLVGEAKLTIQTGLAGFYRVDGYRDEQGQSVMVEAMQQPKPTEVEDPSGGIISQAAIKEVKDVRWLINNGSQIVGPLSSQQIAQRLFAQELDFDCECWAEGTGDSSRIKEAGIFTGSNDKKAHLWIFDGEMIHGPMTSGFLRTAQGHGAIPKDCFYCEKSTVNGWKSISEWKPDDADTVEDEVTQAIQENALRASLAPPRASRTTPKQPEEGSSDPAKKKTAA